MQAAANINKPVFYGLIVALALFAGFLTIRKPNEVHDFFKSLKLAVAILIMFTLAVVAGTLILQNVEPAKYLQHYSTGFYGFVKLLTLGDTYHSLWFSGLVILLNLNLLICTINKLPIRKRNIGFFLIHLSILLVVIGGSISAFFGIKGYIHFNEGTVVDHFQLTQYNKMLDETRDLGFQLRLDKFEVDHYGPDYRIYVYTKDKGNAKFGKPFSFKAKEDATYSIKSRNAELKVLKFFPDYAVREIAVLDDSGPGATQVNFHHDGRVETAYFFDVIGEDRFFMPNQQGIIIFKWNMPKDIRNVVSAQSILHVTFPDGTHKDLSVEKGKTYPFTDDTTIQVGRFIPSFTIDNQTKQIISKGNNPDNPALELIFENKRTKEKKNHWVFANYPDFSHGAKLPGDAKISFTYVPTIKDKPIYVVASDGSFAKVVNGKVQQKAKLKNNMLVFDKYSFEFKSFVAHAKRKREEFNRSDKLNNPVVRIEWTENGQTETYTFSAKDKNATFLDNDRVALLLRNKDDTPKAYRSYMSVLKDGKVVKKKTVEVNSPLVYGGYYFYQSNYDPKDPTYSGILVVRDPGVYIVFLGFFLLVIGGILRFYFKM